jgi:hypothetical protein
MGFTTRLQKMRDLGLRLCFVCFVLIAGCKTNTAAQSSERASAVVVEELSKQLHLDPAEFRRTYNIQVEDRGSVWHFWVEPKARHPGGQFMVDFDKATERLSILAGI